MPMAGPPSERDILIDAPADVVWHLITAPDQLTQWFADRVDLVFEPGARDYLGFGDQGGPVQVEVVDPPSRLSFRWNHRLGQEPGPGYSMLVEFTLTAEGPGRTRVRVTETGHREMPWPAADQQRYAAEHTEGWGDFLARLAVLAGPRRDR
jgi:uncharacterized protein YndB with AHSA1/START domain